MLQALPLAVTILTSRAQPEDDFASVSCVGGASSDPSIVVRITHRGNNVEIMNDNNNAVTAVRLEVRDERGNLVARGSLPHGLDWSDKRSRSLRPGETYTLRFSSKRGVPASENIPLSEFGYRLPNGVYAVRAQAFLSWDNPYSSQCAVTVKR